MHNILWLDDKTLKISGVIDEHFDLHKEIPQFKDQVTIDLSGIERINSCGVREWIKAISKSTAQLFYRNCSSVIVNQFSMIPELIGARGQVLSFEAPYICLQCDHEESLMLVVGKDIQAGLSSYDEEPELVCKVCGSLMEGDHNPELYFSFLSHAG